MTYFYIGFNQMEPDQISVGYTTLQPAKVLKRDGLVGLYHVSIPCDISADMADKLMQAGSEGIEKIQPTNHATQEEKTITLAAYIIGGIEVAARRAGLCPKLYQRQYIKENPDLVRLDILPQELVFPKGWA